MRRKRGEASEGEEEGVHAEEWGCMVSVGTCRTPLLITCGNTARPRARERGNQGARERGSEEDARRGRTDD
eukprot:958747-Rhodomonas_salina.1